MKKLMFSFAAMAIIGAASYAAIKANNSDREFTALELANIEALTTPEGGSSSSWDCWSTGKEGGIGFWLCGNPCVFLKNATKDGKSSKCYKN